MTQFTYPNSSVNGKVTTNRKIKATIRGPIPISIRVSRMDILESFHYSGSVRFLKPYLDTEAHMARENVHSHLMFSSFIVNKALKIVCPVVTKPSSSSHSCHILVIKGVDVRELPTPCSSAQTRTVSLPRETHACATLTALVIESHQ